MPLSAVVLREMVDIIFQQPC